MTKQTVFELPKYHVWAFWWKFTLFKYDYIVYQNI